MSDCIFCKIVRNEAPADILYEDEYSVVFKSINPVAPVHLLVVPKKHIISVDHIVENDKKLIGHLFLVAQKVAAEQGIDSGYKLAVNVGRAGGQEVFHLHIHLLGGWKNARDRDIPNMP